MLRTNLAKLDNWKKIPSEMQNLIIWLMDCSGLIAACEQIYESDDPGLGNLTDYTALYHLLNEAVWRKNNR